MWITWNFNENLKVAFKRLKSYLLWNMKKKKKKEEKKSAAFAIGSLRIKLTEVNTIFCLDHRHQLYNYFEVSCSD